MPAKILEKLVSDDSVLEFMRKRAKHELSLKEDRFPVFEPYAGSLHLAYVQVEGAEYTDMEDDPDGFGVYLIYRLSDISGIFIVTAQQSMTSIRRARNPQDGWVVRCAPNYGNGFTARFWRNAPGRPLPVDYFKGSRDVADLQSTAEGAGVGEPTGETATL